MSSFALYRLPHQTVCTLVEQTSGEVLELSSCKALNDQQGFVVAPFFATPEEPILLIRPTRLIEGAPETIIPDSLKCHFEQVKPQLQKIQNAPLRPIASADDKTYAADFDKFHDELVRGNFRKLVLSRCETINRADGRHPVELFREACRCYSRLFVALVYTPRSGLWLMATPEILLEGQDDRWRTIALAGTMQLKGNDLQSEGEHVCWSTKNIEEQRLVATYIAEQLKPFATDISEEGPRTVRAANLVHLRSDFTFTLLINTRVGDLLAALHPTPAVCGLPKQSAFRFIVDNEHTPRHYYSGFLGPLGLSGQTHLYVSLRCMQIHEHYYSLYAGGGLLRESICQQEWQETESKLETMRRVITP